MNKQHDVDKKNITHLELQICSYFSKKVVFNYATLLKIQT